MAAWVLIAFVLLPISAYAAGVDTEALTHALPTEIREEIGITPESGDLSAAMKSLLRKGEHILREGLEKILAEGFVILAASAACGMFSAFVGPLQSESLGKTVEVTGICTVAALSIGGASGVLDACHSSIDRLSSFSSVFVPVYGAAVTISGHPAAALSSATATLLASNLLLTLAGRLLIPIIYLHIVLSAAGLISENDLMGSLADLLRKGALGFFKYFLMLYTGYISLSGLISSGTDALTLRTAKTTISGSVPVLGSVISDVSETLLSGAVVLKNAIGIYGFVGAVALCLAPFVTAAIRYLAFKLLTVTASGVSNGRMGKLLSAIAESYSMALGLLGTCCMLLFLSFVVGSVVISH